MSPEQARGKPVDKRADIWAFGCVLYEMLTGRRAFAGEDVTDTLAFIITKEPDWNALPIETPPSLRRLLRRCLEKDLRRRLHDIGDARLEIEDTGHEAPGDASPTQRTAVAGRHVEFQRLTDFSGMKEAPAAVARREDGRLRGLGRRAAPDSDPPARRWRAAASDAGRQRSRAPSMDP